MQHLFWSGHRAAAAGFAPLNSLRSVGDVPFYVSLRVCSHSVRFSQAAADLRSQLSRQHVSTRAIKIVSKS